MFCSSGLILPLLVCRVAEERLKSCDDAFREQLEAKQRSHDSHMTQLMKQKNQEIEQANQRVGLQAQLSMGALNHVPVT